MKKLLFSLLIFFISTSLFSQESEHKSKLRLKVEGGLSSTFQYGTELNLFGIQAAIQLRTPNNHLHQATVINLGIGRGWNRSGDNNRFNLGLAYEYLLPLSIFPNNEDLHAYLGMGADVSIFSYSFDPDFSNLYNRAHTTYFNRIYLLPLIQKNINDRLFLEFALPIYWGQWQIVKTRNEDPSISPELQRNEWSNAELFFGRFLSLRIGFGVNL